MAPRQYSQSNFIEITLFAGMVAVIGTVVLVVMWEYPWLSAVFLGGGVGALAGVVLAVLFRRPQPAKAPKPIGRAPRAAPGREGAVVPARGAEGEPNTTLQSRTLAGATDAGGVGRPATPEARSPLDPAEMPVAGAGGPTVAPSAADARERADRGPAPRDMAARDTAPRGPAPAGADRGPVIHERPAAEEAARPVAPSVMPAAEPLAAAAPLAVAPAPLATPRGGQPDDLTRIRGIGPALQDRLREHGIFHLDQIADWGPGEVAWADTALEDFRGRATRDDWVGQARALLGR